MQTQANNLKKNVETLLLEECVLFKTKYGNDYQKNAFLQCLLQTADICIERPIASGLNNMQIRAKKETKNVKATIHTGYAFSKKIKKYDHKNRIILPRLFQTYASCTTNPNASDLGNMQRCAAEEFREAETALHAGYASLSQSINNHHKKNCIIPTRMSSRRQPLINNKIISTIAGHPNQPDQDDSMTKKGIAEQNRSIDPSCGGSRGSLIKFDLVKIGKNIALVYTAFSTSVLLPNRMMYSDLLLWIKSILDIKNKVSQKCDHQNAIPRDKKQQKRCDFNRLLGIRIGEAKNPGPGYQKKRPKTNEVTFAITNPTSMMNKTTEFDDLVKNYEVQVISCSENSATSFIQKQMTKKFHTLGMGSIWSEPVQQQRQTVDGQQCLRGRAGGTSLHSLWPIRPAGQVPKAVDFGRDRLTHTIIQMGTLHVQVVVIYGVTGSAKGHQDVNAELMSAVIQMIQAFQLPSIIMGDFNVDVDTWEPADCLRMQGYLSLQQIHQKLYSKSMPPTCKGVTTPDTALIHPAIVDNITTIAVLPEDIFDTHRPVLFRFRTPWTQICMPKMRMPQTWISLPLDADDLQQVVNTACEDMNQPTDLTTWAELVEHTVDLALQKESQKYEEGSVPKRLPKKMRGRCVPRKIIQAPIWSPCKKAGSGDFNPELECYTIASKRMFKQIRRIQSLRRRLQRTQNYGEIWESTWVAIIRYRHKGLEFLLWALDTPELVPVPNDLPTDEWLLSAQQFLQHDLQHQLFHEHSVHKAKLAMQHEIDRKYGQRKQAFATLRDQVNPPFNKVQRLENDIAIAVGTAKDAEYEIYVDNPSRFSKLDPLQINGHEAKITSFDQNFLTIKIISAHESLPEEVEINQMVFKYQVQECFCRTHELLDAILAKRRSGSA